MNANLECGDPGAIARIPLFRDLTAAELSAIVPLLHCRTFPAGATIVTAEQPAEAAYIIGRGTVRVHVERADGTDVSLAILGAGELLGEMGLLDNLTRSASAVALEESTLLWMDRAAFSQCLRTTPMMTFNLV